MDPEIWIAVAAVFVSGGAIGTAGTLLTQWIVRGLAEPGPRKELPDAREVARLRSEMATLVRKVRNMDDRLDFQEKLLGGASPTHAPPPRLPEPEPPPDGEGPNGGGGGGDARDGGGPGTTEGAGP